MRTTYVISHQTMKINRISFSNRFKQQYASMDKKERDSVDNALAPLDQVLAAMDRHDLHFCKMSLRFNIRGPNGVLHVFIHNNPIRAVVKIADKS